jgi:hypothetical protein
VTSWQAEAPCPANADEAAQEPNAYQHDADTHLIPAGDFAALVGRTLRTLSNWDREGLTHPIMIRRRRYYTVAEAEAIARKDPGAGSARPGSKIKHLLSVMTMVPK